MHILQGETGGGRNRVFDQLGPVRDAGHAQPCFVQLYAGAFIMGFQQRAGIIAHINRGAESGGNSIGGDVVMRRADPARGEHMVVMFRQILYGSNDRTGIIGHHAHLFQINPVTRQRACQMVRVGVLRAS